MLDNPLEPNHVLAGRYRVTSVQRVTGLSALYEANDLHAATPPRRFAVKEEILEGATPSETDALVARFERKIALLKVLSHPAIPPIIDGFVQGNLAYLVMEYIEGKDLEDVMNEARGFLPTSQIYRWAVELADVLNYLHTRKPHPLVFRDIKPSNVMIDPDGHVKLVDYGISEVVSETAFYQPLGTDGYAAPEQYDGHVSPAIDQYALGATLHHLLTRTDPRLQPPFSFGKRSIRAYNPKAVWEFGAIVMRALAYDPHDRFDSMADMLESLHLIADKIPA